MRNLYWIAIAGAAAGILSAQTPNFSGTWKSTDQSKGLPDKASYIAVITTKDGRMTQQAALFGQREQRTMLNFDLSGKEGRGYLRGLPLHSIAKFDGGVLNVEITQPGNRKTTMKYTLSADGNTLTIDMKSTNGQREMAQTLVMAKGTDADAEMLKKPEQTAADSGRYKNLKVLGSLPASQIGETMDYWAFALGKECSFCHVQGNFAADDKAEKATARKMAEMTMAINKGHFDNRPQIRCFTCHQGSGHPPAPKF